MGFPSTITPYLFRNISSKEDKPSSKIITIAFVIIILLMLFLSVIMGGLIYGS